MGGTVSPALTAAIANSGGLGMIAGISATPDKLRTAIQQTNSLTHRPFGVNLVFKDDVAPLVDVALEEQVKVFSFFWGDPKPFSETIHQTGGLVMHTVSSVDEAKRSLDSETDIIAHRPDGLGIERYTSAPLTNRSPGKSKPSRCGPAKPCTASRKPNLPQRSFVNS